MSDPTEPVPRTNRLTEALKQAQGIHAQHPHVDDADALSRLRYQVEHSFRIRRRRRHIAAVSPFIAVLVWAASVMWHPIWPSVCAHLTRWDVFLLGVLPSVALALSAVMVYRENARLQMACRGVLGAVLLLATALAWVRPGLLPLAAPIAAASAGVALLSLSRVGLEAEAYRGRFSPRAVRDELTALIIAGTANAGMAAFIVVSNHLQHASDNVVAVAMMVWMGGVFAVQRWGLVVAMLGNVLVVLLAALDGLHGFPELVETALAAIAALQLILGSRIWWLVRRGLHRELPPPRIWLTPITVVLICGLMVGAVMSWAAHDSKTLERTCTESLEEK